MTDYRRNAYGRLCGMAGMVDVNGSPASVSVPKKDLIDGMAYATLLQGRMNRIRTIHEQWRQGMISSARAVEEVGRILGDE